MHSAQITELGDQISKFVAANGVLAFFIVLAALTLLAVFGGLVYVVILVVRMQGKQLDASAERDKRIDRVSVRVDDVADNQDKLKSLVDTNTKAFDKLVTSVDANTDLTRSTIKSYQTLEENFVASYDAASKVIGLSGDDVKKNSNANTQKIIDEIANLKKALEAPDGALRQDAKANADRIIQELQSLVQKNNALEMENEILRLAKESAEAKLAELQDKNAGTSTDKDGTLPLTFLMGASVQLSPSDGEHNREVIDATKTEQEPTKL